MPFLLHMERSPMLQVPEKTLTLDEFLALPDTQPASEYIDGEIIQKPMPQGKHSAVQSELVTNINAVVKKQRIAYAFPELRCTFDGRSIVPDVAVFCWQRIPVDAQGNLENRFEAAPDWTIEIVSPNQNLTKLTRKVLHCLDHGCQVGWVFDPEEAMLLVYPAKQQPQFFDAATDRLPAPEFAAGLSLTLGDMLGWLNFQVG
jgi:Uma2 family endonuclease